MTYRMERVSDNVMIGQQSDGTFDIEIWENEIHEGECNHILIPTEHAQDISMYLLKNT